MAGYADPNTSPPQTSLFLCCFGFFGNRANNSTKVHQKTSWFRRSTFLFNQSAAGTKSIPLDPGKIHRKKNSAMFIIKSKLKKKSAALELPSVKSQTPAPVKSPQEQTPHKIRSSLERKISSETGKMSILTDRKIDFIRNASSQPGSPDKTNRKNMSRSTSFPARVSTKQAPEEVTKNDLDPMIGMCIIIVTLIILLIWGRLCAILCACTWLYFVPRLRKKPDQTVLVRESEPEEYKKKRVVFEGFLERNHNRSFL